MCSTTTVCFFFFLMSHQPICGSSLKVVFQLSDTFGFELLQWQDTALSELMICLSAACLVGSDRVDHF